MTGHFYLDWAALSLSLFNTILMLWLGLTIMLNSERRTAGNWLVVGSLLLAALFFVSHSAILTFDLDTVSRGLDFWWRVGWWPALGLPLAWYVLVLWYSGYWDNAAAPLRRRHQAGLWAGAGLLLALVALVIFANPLPNLGQFERQAWLSGLSFRGVPMLVALYGVYLLLCVSLALDALLRPGPTSRVLGELARRRARPWLAGASLVFLLVSLLVGAVMLWIVRAFEAYPALALGPGTPAAQTIARYDLAIEALIALAMLLLGQALVAYEVFTGKTLPRRGLLRYWRNALVLAAGYAGLAGWSLAVQLRPIYSVLLTTVLVSALYALFSWRAYAERERSMRQLRPFVTSQRLYDHALAAGAAQQAPGSSPDPAEPAAAFRALCREVLGARLAWLAALGPTAALAGEPLAYAETGAAPARPPADLAELAAQAGGPERLLLPVEPARAGGAHWAVPLWSERGLIGLLLLGDKSDGGLYTQEEIEIARAAGERLIDTHASAELARRLLALQRQRLAESQVLDRRARRVLHDEVLPQLHAAMLQLNSVVVAGQNGTPAAPHTGANGTPAEAQAVAGAVGLLAGVHRQLSNLLRDLPAAPTPEVARLGLLEALRQLVSGEMARAFDRVDWAIDPAAERRAAALPTLAAEVLFYAAREAMRNAARYGRGPGSNAPLHLRLRLDWLPGRPDQGELRLTVEDNGVGLAAPPAGNGPNGLSRGTGQGLALHSTLLAVLGGSLAVESEPGRFTRVVLRLPE